MPSVVELPHATWGGACKPDQQAAALQALEAGQLICLPALPFELDRQGATQLRPTAGGAKNISWDASRGLRGAGSAHDLAILQSMLSRYARASRRLLDALLPSYSAQLQVAKTSFRPNEVSARKTSWRQDDTRLHVDSFPASPVQRRWLLRVFSNVNPDRLARLWKFGQPFPDVARRFLPALRPPWPASAAMLQRLGLTRGRRSAYDHYMLRLHDAMKADLDYQAQVPHTLQAFAPGSSWIVFSDEVSHAALSGQHALEQTFLLPVEAMGAPWCAPVAVLEGLLKRRLA